MSAAPLKQQTYLLGWVEQMAQVQEFFDKHETAEPYGPTQRYFLAGTDPGDRIELPLAILRMLQLVVRALPRGSMVNVIPRTMTVTTQEAADLLGISRSTVIKLVDEGDIPHDRDGRERKILLADLLEYRERRRAEHNAALRLI